MVSEIRTTPDTAQMRRVADVPRTTDLARRLLHEAADELDRLRAACTIDRQQEEWMCVGGVHRTWRIAQNESQGECCKRLGIRLGDLAAMEAGRMDPAPLIADTPEVLRNAR